MCCDRVGHQARGVFDGTLPCGAAGLLGSSRFARERLGDHRIDLIAVEGSLRVLDQRLGEGEHDGLIFLDDRECRLVAMLDEGRAARIGAADYPRDGIRTIDVALYVPGRAIPEDRHLGSTAAH
jgi:hypothetical protein